LAIPFFAQELQSPRAYTTNPWFPTKFGEGKRHYGVGFGSLMWNRGPQIKE
jgi:hypothetical protein